MLRLSATNSWVILFFTRSSFKISPKGFLFLLLSELEGFTGLSDWITFSSGFERRYFFNARIASTMRTIMTAKIAMSSTILMYIIIEEKTLIYHLLSEFYFIMAASVHNKASPAMRTYAQRKARLRSTLRFGRRRTDVHWTSCAAARKTRYNVRFADIIAWIFGCLHQLLRNLRLRTTFLCCCLQK